MDKPLRVIRPPGSVGSPTRLFLTSSNNASVALAADYQDVVFKFECIGIMIAPSAPPEEGGDELLVVQESQRTSCLLRFEWERPAQQGEVPTNMEQIVRTRGKRSQIVASATAICVSMVGVIFHDEGEQTAAIVLSDDEPGTLRVLGGNDAVTFFSDCEVVPVEDASKWLATLV
jgi:hypothetical protein